MTLGAEDMKTPHGDDLFLISFALDLDAIVNPGPLFRRHVGLLSKKSFEQEVGIPP